MFTTIKLEFVTENNVNVCFFNTRKILHSTSHRHSSSILAHRVNFRLAVTYLQFPTQMHFSAATVTVTFESFITLKESLP